MTMLIFPEGRKAATWPVSSMSRAWIGEPHQQVFYLYLDFLYHHQMEPHLSIQPASFLITQHPGDPGPLWW